ncbi:uncharacterized protein LOC128574200 [Nycticebus coucang]|uniref:uncharacterized protein LOC128574200 n=1 Tax=Nycticebus coucang TaxID=9470 RepID=UPI00234D3182|nr:uncharacterized protein LOC128574200 [Nycticebus coucang]
MRAGKPRVSCPPAPGDTCLVAGLKGALLSLVSSNDYHHKRDAGNLQAGKRRAAVQFTTSSRPGPRGTQSWLETGMGRGQATVARPEPALGVQGLALGSVTQVWARVWGGRGSPRAVSSCLRAPGAPGPGVESHAPGSRPARRAARTARVKAREPGRLGGACADWGEVLVRDGARGGPVRANWLEVVRGGARGGLRARSGRVDKAPQGRTPRGALGPLPRRPGTLALAPGMRRPRQR